MPQTAIPDYIELNEACPKCLNPECKGDCGLFTEEEKAENIRKRYFDDNLDGFGRVKVPVVQLAKNPIGSFSIGSYKRKSKWDKKR